MCHSKHHFPTLNTSLWPPLGTLNSISQGVHETSANADWLLDVDPHRSVPWWMTEGSALTNWCWSLKLSFSSHFQQSQSKLLFWNRYVFSKSHPFPLLTHLCLEGFYPCIWELGILLAAHKEGSSSPCQCNQSRAVTRWEIEIRA